MKINTIIFPIVFVIVFSSNFLFAQLGINSDNSAPSTNAMLDVKSSNKGILIPRVGADLASPTEGLLYYNTTGHNFRYYDGTAWQNALFGNQWNVNLSKISYSAGNVGIGVADPIYKLHVNGNFHTTGNYTTDGWIGIGGSPNYKLNIFDGSMAITSTTDSKTWALNYNSAGNYLQLNEGITPRMYFQNGGYVGIGINPLYALDVAGTIHSSNNLRAGSNIYAEGNAYIDGTAVVNGNKGVAYNANSSTNLKIHRFTTLNILPILGPHDISAEFTIGFNGGFTSAPTVFVGDIDLIGGAPPEFYGTLYMVKLQIYGCNATSCKARVVNLSDASIKYNVTWNMMAVGN